jgi:CRP-like cAMP-binding protein
MKTIIFEQILSAVEEATEVNRALILSKNKQREVVEARSLLFHYLFCKDLTRKQIADLTGHTRQCVAAQIQSFPDKDIRNKWLTAIMRKIEDICCLK